MNNSIILIVGLGKTGLSCLKFLSQSSAQILINDSRKNPPGIDIVKKNYADCALVLGQWDKNYFERADEIVLSPGVSLQEPLVKEAIESGKKVYGDIELFVNHVDKPIVAITGSNGKSTVTTMVGKMAENANLNVISTLQNKYDCNVGYSGHEVGLSISCAATALGITSLERHITLDRTMYGSDQSASVEPFGFNSLVNKVREIETAMGDGIKRILDQEISIAKNLRQHLNIF